MIHYLATFCLSFVATFSYDRASGGTWQHCLFLAIGVACTTVAVHRLGALIAKVS